MQKKIYKKNIIVCLYLFYYIHTIAFCQPETITKEQHGCTTFSLTDNDLFIFGRSLDTDIDTGYLFINKKDMDKTAYFNSESTEEPATWTSQYGSITLNQISREIPHGGMNECGLVIEHMYLANSDFPDPDSRPAVISHQWIQYMLDNCSTVSEVIGSDTLIRISDTDYKFPVHFHIMDSTGNRAIIEYLNGNFTVYNDGSYTACALTNNTYSYLLNYISDFTGWGGSNPIPVNATGSPDRFVKAADMVKNYPGNDIIQIIQYGFTILDSVRANTQWQIIYDPGNLQIYYRTLSDTAIKTLNINDFDYSCTNDIECISVNANPAIPANWNVFSTPLNTTLINTLCSLSGFVNSILGSEKDEIAVYPENNTECATTLICKNELNGNIRVFPNPFNNYLTLKGGLLYGDIFMEIIDLNGRTVYYKKCKNTNGSIILNDLDLKGTFLIKIEKPSGKYSVKRIICK